MIDLYIQQNFCPSKIDERREMLMFKYRDVKQIN